MTPIKLIVLQDNKVISEFLISGKKVLNIGRGDKISNQFVSRNHIQVFFNNDNRLIFQDVGSTHGTELNGRKIDSGREYLLEIGSEIKLAGDKGVLILVQNENYSIDNLQTGDRDTSISEAIKKKTSKKVTIGRSKSCDFPISGSTVSRVHASIELKKIKGNFFYLVRDNKSLNGTYVNGRKIYKPTIITKNDKIFIGSYVLTLNGTSEYGGRSIQNLRKNKYALKAYGIRKDYVKKGKSTTVLQKTDIKIESKSSLALMGPSGCGKSTLLKILLGDVKPTAGSVEILGLDLHSNFEYLKSRIGYVPQDDIIHKELTVYQSLRFTAKLRLSDASDAQIDQKINDLLTKFGVKHIKDKEIGSISGGQRKRISIAVELISDPDILFLDEPTSPLDPQTIVELLDLVKKLTSEGRTVIMVTHKPSDLDYLDKVIFMAACSDEKYYEGGGVCFFDVPEKIKSHFKVTESWEVFKLISSKKAQIKINEYKNSHISKSGKSITNKNKVSSQSSPISQYLWLTYRYFTIKFNDRVNSAIMLVQAPIIAILICMIFPRITSAVLFISAISAIWFGCNNAAREVVGEKHIYRRERMYNLYILPYIFSKITVLSFFSIIQSALFILILSIYYDGISPDSIAINDPHYAFFWMSFLSISSSFLGLLLSSVMDTTEKVMTIVPIVLIPQIMLAGLVTNIHNGFIEFLSYLTLSRWGTEGFHKIQKKIEKQCINPQEPSETSWCTDYDAVGSLHKMFDDSYSDNFNNISEMPIDIWAVLIMSLIFLFCIWFALRRKDPN